MTIGIYALTFKGTDKVYVGQAINIEKRFLRHISILSLEYRTKVHKHKHPKLYAAFVKYGLPSILILEICSADLLNSSEVYWIEEFDSLNNGYNVCSGGSSGRGPYSGSSIYTKEQVLEAFKYLQNPQNTYEFISKEVNMPASAVCAIFTGSTHVWLQEECPEEYSNMVGTKNARWKYANKIGHTKISAASKDIQYPDIIGPDGTIYSNISNIRAFALLHKLDAGNLIKLMDGKYKSCKGFTLKNSNETTIRGSKVYGALISPEGVVFKDITNIKAFSENHALCSSSIGKVLRGERTGYKGWGLYILNKQR